MFDGHKNDKFSTKIAPEHLQHCQDKCLSAYFAEPPNCNSSSFFDHFGPLQAPFKSQNGSGLVGILISAALGNPLEGQSKKAKPGQNPHKSQSKVGQNSRVNPMHVQLLFVGQRAKIEGAKPFCSKRRNPVKTRPKLRPEPYTLSITQT